MSEPRTRSDRSVPNRASGPSPAEVDALIERMFGREAERRVERVPEGVSTYVYRIHRRAGTLYLRILPEVGARYTPEALAHARLHQLGVRVPEVVYVDDRDEHLGLAVMVTTEIPGEHVGRRPTDALARQVVIEAGRQLALVNQIPVDGYGWIRRDDAAGDRLAGPHPTFARFVREHLDADLDLLHDRVLGNGEVVEIRAVVREHSAWLESERATLAHGDFDVTQIFQQDGRYTGIIDFGEIRGGDAWYDLGHFRMHDGETLPRSVLDWLLAGYRDVAPLTANFMERIAFASLLIAVRALGRRLIRSDSGVAGHIALAAVQRELSLLRT